MSQISNKIELRTREVSNVIRFFEASKDEQLQKLFPFQKQTVEQAIELYHQSLRPSSTSFGKTIYYQDTYIGDIWCYAIDEKIEHQCFLSIVIFNKDDWGKGIGTIALESFIQEIKQRYRINKVCAFTYKENIASIKTLQKTGFQLIEEFMEGEILSCYFERQI